MFNFRKKDIAELQTSENDLKFSDEILNEIHHYLFSGEELNLEIIEDLMLKLQITKEGVEEYFANQDKSLKGKVKKEFIRFGRYTRKEFIYFGILILSVLILGDKAMYAALALALFKQYNDEADDKLDVVIENKDKSINELFQIMNSRIKHYENVLKLKQSKLRVISDSNDRENNILILANEYLEMCLDDRITLDDIPVNIQNVILVMLQNELGEGSLEELLNQARSMRLGNTSIRNKVNKN